MNNKLFSFPSPEIDRHYGFEIDRIEKTLYQNARSLRPEGNLSNLSHVLHDGHQTWVGLEPQTLLTPYQELVQVCEYLKPKPGETFVDLGAGYGRLGLVLNDLHPGVNFLGYELVKERVNEGNRVFQLHDCRNAQLITEDLTRPDFKIPTARYYFLYDYGKVAHIRETLKQLEVIAERHNFKIVARGKGSRSIIDHEHPWLSDIYPVIREQNYAIYSMSLEDNLF